MEITNTIHVITDTFSYAGLWIMGTSHIVRSIYSKLRDIEHDKIANAPELPMNNTFFDDNLKGDDVSHSVNDDME